MAFRHSARNLPFRLSMKALSVGLPGRLKSKVMPFAVRGRKDRFPHNCAAPRSHRQNLFRCHNRAFGEQPFPRAPRQWRAMPGPAYLLELGAGAHRRAALPLGAFARLRGLGRAPCRSTRGFRTRSRSTSHGRYWPCGISKCCWPRTKLSASCSTGVTIHGCGVPAPGAL